MREVAKVLSALPMPALVINPDYRIETANAAATELFGPSIEGISVVSLLRQAPVLAAIDQALRDGRNSHAQFVYPGTSGEISYRFRAAPISDADGKTDGAVLSLEDRSHQEESEIMRRDFVANISHELRTPLTSLVGFIETLRTTAKDDPDARTRFLAIMEEEALRMSRMVSDLLSLSHVEADERIRPRSTVDLAAILRSVIATLEGKLADANVTVTATGLDQRFPIMGDRDQLIQLFLNLMENAIKYGGGDRTIHVALSDVDRDQTLRCAAVRVDIRDEGEGIDEIHLPRLTERFYRVDNHRSRQKGGTGLGLSIVKHIINRHRGRLKVTSEQGVGSVFSTIFPSA